MGEERGEKVKEKDKGMGMFLMILEWKRRGREVLYEACERRVKSRREEKRTGVTEGVWKRIPGEELSHIEALEKTNRYTAKALDEDGQVKRREGRDSET